MLPKTECLRMGVVHFNEFEYFGSGIFQTCVRSAFQNFGLEAREERFVEHIYVVCDPETYHKDYRPRHTLPAMVFIEQF